MLLLLLLVVDDAGAEEGTRRWMEFLNVPWTSGLD